MLGGADSDGHLSDAWILDVGQAGWSRLPSADLPSTTAWHSAYMLQCDEVLVGLHPCHSQLWAEAFCNAHHSLPSPTCILLLPIHHVLIFQTLAQSCLCCKEHCQASHTSTPHSLLVCIRLHVLPVPSLLLRDVHASLPAGHSDASACVTHQTACAACSIIVVARCSRLLAN